MTLNGVIFKKRREGEFRALLIQVSNHVGACSYVSYERRISKLAYRTSTRFGHIVSLPHNLPQNSFESA